MLKTRISLVALAMIAATQAQANDQADSKGFIEDSHANVLPVSYTHLTLPTIYSV